MADQQAEEEQATERKKAVDSAWGANDVRGSKRPRPPENWRPKAARWYNFKPGRSAQQEKVIVSRNAPTVEPHQPRDAPPRHLLLKKFSRPAKILEERPRKETPAVEDNETATEVFSSTSGFREEFCSPESSPSLPPSQRKMQKTAVERTEDRR